MPINVPTFLCLLISPGDVEEERDAIEAKVGEWNGHVGKGIGARVEIVRWETHARPAMGKAPQDTINEQLVDGCDFGIAVFWSRLGSPTARHPSGSAEEVERLLAKGSDVMVYFSDKAIPQANLKGDQFAKLQGLKDDYAKRGLYSTFSTTEKLADLVSLHLTSLVTGRLTQARAEGQPIPSTGTLTAPKPDVRVSVSAAVAAGGGGNQPFVKVTVANHSPVDFFFSSVSIALDGTDDMFAIVREAVFNQPVLPAKIAPGDSILVTFDPSAHGDHVYLNAIVHDKIGRSFVAPPGEMKTAVARFYEWKNVINNNPRG